MFSFFFNLVKKNFLIVEEFFKCRGNGIDRLRIGELGSLRGNLCLYFFRLSSKT